MKLLYSSETNRKNAVSEKFELFLQFYENYRKICVFVRESHEMKGIRKKCIKTHFICFLSVSPPEGNRVLCRSCLLPWSGEEPGRVKMKNLSGPRLLR